MNQVSDSSTQRQISDCLLSIVLPVFNEAGILDELHQQVTEVCRQLPCRFEVIYVNDGSSDRSQEILEQIASATPRVTVLKLSRNFGHQAAVQAGLEQAKGDAIIVMDSDMQDDPQAIEEFVQKWVDGYEVVYAVRKNRKENVIKRTLFHSFYRVLNAISQTPIPMDAGNFGLIDRRVADQIVRLPDRDRFYPGLRSWVGFRQVGVPVERGRRYDEHARVSLAGLFRLAKTAIFSFSAMPLTVFYVIAVLSLGTCFGLIGFTLYHKLWTGLAVPGWTSMTIVASFFGALNALGIGILGEYALRIYDQVRERPVYIVGERMSSKNCLPAKRSEEILNWVNINLSQDADEETIQREVVELMEQFR